MFFVTQESSKLRYEQAIRLISEASDMAEYEQKQVKEDLKEYATSLDYSGEVIHNDMESETDWEDLYSNLSEFRDCYKRAVPDSEEPRLGDALTKRFLRFGL